MKTKPAKKFTSKIIQKAALAMALGFMLTLSACKPPAERLYAEAHSEIEKGHFRIGLDLLEKSAAIENRNDLKYKYLSEAARIARFEIQDYERTIRIYREIILKCEEESQRIRAQESMSEVYLEDLQNYNMALKELQILEPLIKDPLKKEQIKLRIAQTLYLTGNNQQALEEINVSLKFSKIETLNFLKLKAQVLVAQKKFTSALEVYESIRLKDEKYFERENLFIAASVVYEENEEYAEALQYLNKYESQIQDKAYLELRYKRLQERMINKPLFKGRRK